jgi:hypothetical protein
MHRNSMNSRRWSQARAPFVPGWARLSTRPVPTESPSAIISSARSGNAGGVNFLLTTPNPDRPGARVMLQLSKTFA